MSGRKPERKLLAHFVSEEAKELKICWNQQVRGLTRSLAPDLSDCGSHCFELRRMFEGTGGH